MSAGARTAALIGVPALVAGTVAWFAASWLDGGDGAGRASSNVSNVLNAFSQSQGTAPAERFEGELPPGYPDDVPSYPGARVVTSTRQIEDDDVAYLVVFDVAEERERVTRYFREKLEDDPFQIESGQDGRDVTFLQFSRTDDADTRGLVLTSASKDDDLTTIFVSLEITSGAEDLEAPAFQLAPGREVPAGFPDDVPLYPKATVIETQFQKGSGERQFVVSVVTKDEIIDVIDFYRDELEENGWTVEDLDAGDASLEDARAISFSDERSQIGGQILAGSFPHDDTFTQIDIQVRETSSRDAEEN